MKAYNIKRAALCVALGACLATLAPSAFAQDGAVVGRLTSDAGQVPAGATIIVRNPATGFVRSVQADSKGSYRIPLLPVGTYDMEVSLPGGAASRVGQVTVSLGSATTVNVPLGAVSTLGTVEVRAPQVVSMVDVKSTESATNITREELSRLPVDRDITAVALLAPGAVKGKGSLGGQGISFGGSSVAENTVYINGLNVTDFYNRVGFSSVPFSFYQEFQVKTGGYSVEFGRSTGGVINAVTRSGSNDFKAGAELVFEPRAWQSQARDRYDGDGSRYITASRDDYSRSALNVFASGALVQDRLFFFGMYEARDYTPNSTNDAGTVFNRGTADDPFWGGKLDWQITDNQMLSLFGFSDKSDTVTDVYRYDHDTGTVAAERNNQIYNTVGGRNWSGTYSWQVNNDLTMKLMYGENKRNRTQSSLMDENCNRVFDNRTASQGVPSNLQGDRSCTSSSQLESALDTRKAARADFEWSIGNHLLRFGLDREENTSDYERAYPGPGGLRYDIYYRTPGSSLNGGTVPASGLVARTRRYEVAGSFETINSAYYLEDNWQVTPNFLLNIGARVEGFDNKGGDGDSYIKIDNMIAPRLGFAWDVRGDGTTKVFGNLGRYYLPVANVINIKQAGGFLDERTWYEFLGYTGAANNVPNLGGQIGPVDNSQGDGSVPDLRAEVNRDMDPVYQDEAILGFQQMINEAWSVGASVTYRRLSNAIDDMNITATGQCGAIDGVWIMGNPGRTNTVWGDTNCDGSNDGWIDIDTSREGWALYDDDGNYVGQRGWVKPKRDYKALELQVDRAWDGKWGFNASYTLAYGRGNAEGPVNSDTDFADAGRTENFDNPWVNYRGYGYLANDRRHQFKFRGSYALTENLSVAATLGVQSGSPITRFGAGNPFDDTDFHSYYVCVSNCQSTVPSERVFVHSPRGGDGRTPWTYDLDVSVSYKVPIPTDLRLKLAVYNVLNQQRVVTVDQDYEPQDSIGTPNPMYGYGTGFQSPRYAQLTVTWNY
ncbi:TonB-dependent receptor [Stenotrophomonas indicatrix]|uniref:TonB-dependent receptor n=1 Tax=Stenotrophomonas indicatrix TaxID=2045451 RepID=UPI0008D658AB|nr:TonB-dependent receptor [Stenotrophomonas indicatrix]SEU07145.1 TonB-dependent Receptor Plug Domain [Stenotrophomonas indicatrix]